MGKLRRHWGVYGQAADAPVVHTTQQLLQPFHIHRVGEHIFHDFVHQGMVGNLDVANNVFLAGGHVGEHRRQQVVGAHALNLWGDFLAGLKAQQGKGAVGVPAPARAENGGSQRRLLQQGLHGLRGQEVKDIGKRKAVLLGQRDVQARGTPCRSGRCCCDCRSSSCPSEVTIA